MLDEGPQPPRDHYIRRVLHVPVGLIVLVLRTLVEVFGKLAGVAAAVGAALLLSGALPVAIAALHAGGREAAGSLWRWTAALLHRQH